MSAASTLVVETLSTADLLRLVVRFEREPSEGKNGRFYELRIQPYETKQLSFVPEPKDRIPKYELHVTRGSLNGKRSVHRVELFEHLHEAVVRYGHLATERRFRGYVEVR